MTDEDLIKRIGRVVKEEMDLALKPVKETQAKHTLILESHSKVLESHSKKLDALWDQTVELSEDMTEIKITLKSHAVDLGHTKKRVTIVEDHLGI